MKTNKRLNKILQIIGLICIAILTILVYTSNSVLNKGEVISISSNNLLFIILFIAIFVVGYLILDKVNDIKVKRDTKIIIYATLLMLYLIAQILFINLRRSYPVYDQYEVYNDAKIIAEGNIDELIKNEYLQMCPHQIPLITFFVFIFKICGSTNVFILQYLNAIANTFTVLGLYLIAKAISNKQNKLNSFMIVFLSLAFISLSMLSTFVYGDLIGLCFGVFAIYFIIKYGKLQKARYLFISAILISLAYYCRTNMLIFFIALTIYLILDCIKYISSIKNECNDTKSTKIMNIITKVLLIIIFIIIGLLPTNLVKNYMINRLQLEKSNQFPTIGHINHGISNEGFRGPGWYVDSYVNQWKLNGHDEEVLKQRALSIINEYFHNPINGCKFFKNKITSMWIEPTFGEIYYNTELLGLNSDKITEEEFYRCIEMTDFLKNNYSIFVMIGKVLLIIIYTSTLLLILRNKDLTNEQILLVLIFMGGFAFQLFWEGKSRYVLPYVVILIPLASIGVKENIQWINNKINNIKKKFQTEK